VTPEVREVTAPDLAGRPRSGRPDLARKDKGKVGPCQSGVLDGAVARARDQADPGQLGDDGWELVAVIPALTPSSCAYMKREKP